MAQRFIRCQLCGLPHLADLRECPVHHRPIVPAAQMDGGHPIAAPTAPALPARVLPEVLAPVPPLPPPHPPSSPPRPTTDAPLVGMLLSGRYRVTGVIAAGGMGVVYDAVHVALRRPVAVKSLHRRYAGDRVAIARLQQEAMMAGRFGHPNIVEVYDMGLLDDGSPWLVMERLDGETVAQRLLRERPLGISLAVDIAVQVLSALAATHAKGILHRDLKPENLFLVPREGLGPLVKVLDFGVAKALAGSDGSLALTRSGVVLGTPAYMAPEQARGVRDLDVRVDLYAVGMILYETLTGRLPFVSRTVPALLEEIQRAVPVHPRLLRPGVPSDLDAVVLRALSRDRDGRHPDAVSLLRALQSLAPWPDDDPTAPTDDPTEVSSVPEGLPVMDTGSQAVRVFARPPK